MPKLIVLSNHEREILDATLECYLEIEQEAREATRADPTTSATDLADTLDEYQDRKVTLNRIRYKIRTPSGDPYNETLKERML